MVKHGVTEFLQIFQSISQTFLQLESDLLIVLDDFGNIVRVYPGFEKATGRLEYEVLGLPVIALIPQGDLPKFMRSFQTMESFRLLHKDHGIVTVYLDNYAFVNIEGIKYGFLILRRY